MEFSDPSRLSEQCPIASTSPEELQLMPLIVKRDGSSPQLEPLKLETISLAATFLAQRLKTHSFQNTISFSLHVHVGQSHISPRRVTIKSTRKSWKLNLTGKSMSTL